MTVTSRGGWRNTVEGDTCDPIWLSYPGTVTDAATTTVELADDETTWNVGIEGLAPQQWSFALVAPSATTVTEGQDFTVRYAPATPGVAIESVFIDRAGIPARATTAGTQTVHIRDGYWSLSEPTLHGTTKAGELTAKLGPLIVHGCDDAVACTFTTYLPSPGLPITIEIP